MSLAIPLHRRNLAVNLQAGRGTIMDELVTICWLIFLPMEFAMGQPLRMPVFAGVMLLVILHWRQVVPLLKRGWPFFLLPAFCLISTLWSGAPLQSLRYGILIALMLIICAWTAARLTHRQIVVAVLISGAILGLMSIANPDIGYSPGIQGGMAMSGVFPQKNVLGMRMLVLIMASLTILVAKGYALRWKLLGAAVLLPAFYLLVGSKSATSLLLLGATGGLILFLSMVWRPAVKVRGLRGAIVAAAVIATSLGGLVLANVYQVDPVEEVLDRLGKNKTLTGRTDIWLVAETVIDEHPFLGVGAGAFWRREENAATKITAMFQVKDYTFFFHNAYYEVRVHLGVLGVGLFVLTCFLAYRQLIGHWLARQRTTDPFFLAIAAILLVRMVTESEMFMVFLMNPMLFWTGVFLALHDQLEDEPRALAPMPDRAED
ncbi:MAG: O-antigen ligase family protein [Parvularculaceae bacterium]